MKRHPVLSNAMSLLLYPLSSLSLPGIYIMQIRAYYRFLFSIKTNILLFQKFVNWNIIFYESLTQYP